MKPETALHPAPAGILFRLMEQTAGFAGQDFFRELVRSLAAALDTEYAFVTQRLPEDLNRLKLMAGWHVNHAAGGVGEFDVPGTLAERVEQVERQMILDEIKRHNQNITNTAKALGLERSHLYKKCQQLGIDLRELRK